MGKGIGQISSGLDKLATRAAIGAVAGLTAVITTAASFEQAFTGVEKTVDGTDAQLAELEQTLRQMARTIPVSFEELSAIGEAGGALGVARDSLDEFIDVVARLSVSTNLSSDQAATALGQLGTILHLTGSEYEDFADTLVGLGNAGASTEDQIIDLAARFAAAGNSAGLSKEEILALASATASMGIEVEAGGTALSQTFNNIATGIGTGSDEIKAFTDLLGISAADFKKRWTEDALGTFQDFLRELGKLDQYEQADILTNAGITGVRQLNAIKLMTQNVGFLDDQLQIAKNSQGALDKESQKFFDTSVGQWKLLVANVRDAAATIGAELLPVANSLIHDFVEKLQQPGTQAGLKAFGTDLAAGIRGLVDELKGTDFSGIIGGMKIAAQVAKSAFDAFRALPAPIQQLAIAALVANKVSGGAVGQIAKGLGNLVFGALKTINAVNVTVIGKSVIAPGAGGLPTPGGFNWKSLLPWLGGAVVLGAVAAGAEFATSEDRSPLIDRPGGHLGPGDLPWNQNTDALDRNTDAVNENTNPGAHKDTGSRAPKPVLGPPVPTGPIASLSATDFISELSKTTEIGLKGIGTTIEHGITTGLDPFGQGMLALAQSAENPKDPAVLREISNHIIAAEEVQAAYLKEGDINSATRTQAVIDGLHALLGTVDKTLPILEQTKEKSALTALQTANVARMTGSLLEPMRLTSLQSANAARMTERTLSPLERIAAKNPSFTANITTNVSARLSVTQSLYTQTLYNSIKGDNLLNLM